MKPIVVYYSNKGNNKYLADKISKALSCQMEEIKLRVPVFLFVMMGLQFGIKPMKNKIEDYDTIILCGPVFMGKLIPPLRAFVNKYFQRINKLIFVSSCGSPDEKKFEKYGHGLVFKEIESMLKDKCISCEAFPVNLVLPEDQKQNIDIIMKVRLNDDNFKGEIQERFNTFIERVSIGY